MIVVKTVAAFKTYVENKAGYFENSGFVPTMGALHQGHMSLIAACKRENKFTIASIFVNPTQFNITADFQKYPITLAADIEKLEAAGCDLLFLPAVKEIYPDGTANLEHYELGDLENKLEGFYRPGHFQGVCQVVYRLLKIVMPKNLYLGQKDFQQCMVIKKMMALKQLPVELHTVPTVREPAGLAMSSRNMRLNADEKKIAVNIYEQLSFIKQQREKLSPAALKKIATDHLLKAGFTSVDYVEIADPQTLEPLVAWNGKPAVVLLAAWLGDVRLIDNMIA